MEASAFCDLFDAVEKHGGHLEIFKPKKGKLVVRAYVKKERWGAETVTGPEDTFDLAAKRLMRRLKNEKKLK